jgi:hypothetical protein
VLSRGAPGGFYRAGEGAHALGDGARGLVGSRSGERRRGGASVTGRGSCSAGQPKGEPAALGRPVAAAFVSPEVGDGGSGPGGHAVRRRWGGGCLGRSAGQGPRRGGGGLRLGLDEGGGPREVEGEAEQPKAKAQAVGLKTRDGPKLKKKFLSNFKLNLGI